MTRILLGFLFVTASESVKAFNPPDYVEVAISKSGIYFNIKWTTTSPGFQPHEAVEFEVWITPKCFAQPIGGKDNKQKYATAKMPIFYTDVWNYWAPATGGQAVGEILHACEPLSIADYIAIGFLWESEEIIDHGRGNFAVGSWFADQFQTNLDYWFYYPLEPTANGACSDGTADVRMTVFPNTCELPLGLFVEVTCPHFLGWKHCENLTPPNPYEILLANVGIPTTTGCPLPLPQLLAPSAEHVFSVKEEKQFTWHARRCVCAGFGAEPSAQQAAADVACG